MQLLRNNLVVQFSVVGSVITLVIVIGIFIIFSNGFGNIIELLDTHSTAMEMGVAAHGNNTASTEDLQANIMKFRWTAFYVITGGLVGLFSSAWLVVLIGWRTISNQQGVMRRSNVQLHEMHSRVSLILDSVGEGIFGVDAMGKVTFVNPQALQMLGLQTADILGKSAHPIIHHTTSEGQPSPWYTCCVSRSLADGSTHRLSSDIMWTRNGRSFPVEITATPIMENGSVTGAVVAFQDISERLNVEQATRESERHFRDLFNNALDIFIVLQVDGTVQEANAAAEIILGYPQDQMVGKNVFSLLRLSNMSDDFTVQKGQPDIAAWIAEADLQIVAYRHADGSNRMLELNANAFQGEKEEQAILITARDITERSEAEAELRRSRSEKADLAVALENRVTRLRMIADLSQLVSSSLNGLEVLQEIAGAAARITGAPIASFWTFRPESKSVELRTFSDENIGIDFPVNELYLNEGAAGWIAEECETLNVPDVFEDERFVASDWCKAHDFRSFFGMPIVLHGSVLAVLALNGFEPFVLEDSDIELLNIFLTQVAISLQNSMLYEELAVENAERKHFDEALTQYSNELAKANSSLNDAVSERMVATSELKKSEGRIRAVVEQMRDGLIIIDNEGHVESFNPAAEKMFGISESQVIGGDMDTLLTATGNGEQPVRYPACLVDGNLGTGRTKHEFHGRRQDGSIFPIDISASKVNLDNQSLIVSTVRDITERRELEERTKNSLMEKEMLLKEIHHRVKNNLQLVSSLIALQSEYVQNESDRALFKDTQHRVRSMALIHEKLYQTDDLADIDFAVYLQGLVSELARSYRLNPARTSVSVDVESIRLGIDTAIPCGLLVNELVSNAFKYAFPNDAEGEVKVSLHSKDREFTLVVEDNGIGIPENVDWQNTESLGLQLVHTLAGQLGGEVSMNSTEGTRFEIVFLDQAQADEEEETW